MHEIATDVWHIPLAPRAALNAYLVGDVLVDAGIGRSGARLVDTLRGRTVTAHALTHAHGDHVGGSRHVADALDIPVWASEPDAEAVQSGRQVAPPDSRLRRMIERPAWKGVPVARRLAEGDDVAGFTVLSVPGHSPGHIALWRESDGVLVAGDVYFNLNFLTLRPGLREPFAMVTVDPARNRESMRRLAALEPRTVAFGHGPVLRDPAALRACAARLTAA